jgi:hypothetical protein
MRRKFEERYGDEIYVTHDSKLGRTIAAVVDGGSIMVALAQCSKKDQFCRKIGRHIAVGRALKAAKLGFRGGWPAHSNIVTPPKTVKWDDLRERRKWIIDQLLLLIQEEV